jgi:hypothetical protein
VQVLLRHQEKYFSERCKNIVIAQARREQGGMELHKTAKPNSADKEEMNSMLARK